MGYHHTRCYNVNRLEWFFFAQKIGEYAYGFTSDAEEEINGDSITVYGSTVIADATDFIKAFPQYTLDDYLYRLSCARIQFMAVDNTHTKYLRGADKKAWSNYKDAYEAQNKLENLLDRWRIPELKEGEEYDIPIRGKKGKSAKKGNNKK